MKEHPRILIVDDEPHIVQMLDINVHSHGYVSICATNGEQALKYAHTENPDVVLLDVMMPGMDGIEVCRRLKTDPQTKKIPVIMVSAKSEEHDRIAGLQGGADDYVTKPFNLQELFLRIGATLRQIDLLTEDAGGVYHCGSLTLDAEKFHVSVAADNLDLTLTEFRILHLLIQQYPKIVTRAQLATDIYGKDADEVGRSIDVHIRNIRKKLEQSQVVDCEIETVRGQGFKMSSQEDH